VTGQTEDDPMAIPLIRLYTGADGQSHVERGAVDLAELAGDPHRSRSATATEVTFEETPAHASLDWHRAPVRQYVITLSGTLEFETRLGEKFVLAPGIVLLAEDTTGGGHKWHLTDDQPWRRVYVGLD
jgi:quercetin dioxygenase-like cupin family protein